MGTLWDPSLAATRRGKGTHGWRFYGEAWGRSGMRGHIFCADPTTGPTQMPGGWKMQSFCVPGRKGKMVLCTITFCLPQNIIFIEKEYERQVEF